MLIWHCLPVKDRTFREVSHAGLICHAGDPPETERWEKPLGFCLAEGMASQNMPEPGPEATRLYLTHTWRQGLDCHLYCLHHFFDREKSGKV